MREVYIVTFGGGINYGSCLQATALCRKFKMMGYDAAILEHFTVPSVFIKHPILLGMRIKNKLNSSTREKFFNSLPYDVPMERKCRLELYENEHTKRVDITNDKQWNDIVKNKGIFVVGSDIIWQPALGYPAKNFLDFAYYSKLKMFSYASSIGAKQLPEEYYPFYKKYLSAYAGVSVREKSAAKMLSDITGINVKNVVDPTLLLKREEWDEFADRATFSIDVPSNYILCYFVMDDPRYWQYLSIVHAATDLPVIVLPMHYSAENQPYSIIKDGTPYEFIWLIKNAEFVLTDSFHACVFSVIYEKEFYLMRRSRKDEDAKYDDFLNKYELITRQINDESLFERDFAISYKIARQKIAEDRNYSIKYLEDCLGKEK